MTSTTPRTIDRRDAAVTAALSGAVLVIVGYASGIGIKPAAEVTATLPQQPAPSAVTEPAPAPQAPVAVAPPIAPVPVPAAPAPTTAVPAPASSHVHSPAPDPTPTTPPTEPTACATGMVPGLVDTLPVVGAVSPLVTGLLRPVLGVVGLEDVAATCPTPDTP
jgi:hypothetical protein